MSICTLRIGDRVVLASEGGAPEVEYLLFDPSEVEFRSTGFAQAQEVAYQTTAGEAKARLASAGFSWPVLLQCVSAMQPTLAVTYARGPAVRRVATALGAAELFEASSFDAATKVYVGRWLDLDALGADAAIPGLMQALQGLYLLALLREVGGDDPVRLATRELMAQGRAGSRSYRRWTPEPLTGLPKAIREFAAKVRDTPPAPPADEGGMSSSELREQVSDRVVFAQDLEAKDRLRALEKAIEIRDRPAQPPLADPELWAIDEQLSAGRTDGVTELVDSIEESKGKHPATDYLRVRAAFLTGRETPRAVAERAASLAMSTPSFVQLQLLASEAWIAAGDPDRALLFAGDLLGDTRVDPDLPVPQTEQLAGERATSVRPSKAPPPRATLPPPVSSRTANPRASAAPPRPSAAPLPRTPPPPPDTAPELEPRRAASLEGIGQMRGASQPPFRKDSVGVHVHVPRAAPPPRLHEGSEASGASGDEAAVLPLPEGLRGAPAPIEVLPKNVLDARVQFTFLSRELGLDYENRLGIVLRADASGLEAMGRVLLERYAGRAVATPAEAADVHRHGALLSEVLARSLGAFWVDVAPGDIGYWAMLVPPGTRVWPFGWVLRVIVNADPDETLVSYFKELSARAGP